MSSQDFDISVKIEPKYEIDSAAAAAASEMPVPNTKKKLEFTTDIKIEPLITEIKSENTSLLDIKQEPQESDSHVTKSVQINGKNDEATKTHDLKDIPQFNNIENTSSSNENENSSSANIHTTEGKTCYLCSKKLANKEYKKHMLLHTNEVKKSCLLCKKKYLYQKNLIWHLLNRHANRIKLQCTTCSTKFPNEAVLEHHLLTHSGTIYSCDLCNEDFSAKIHLQLHLRKKHEGWKLLVCKFCQMEFVYESALKRHEASHNGKKLYCCDICGVTFIKGGQLTRHMMIHTGEKRKKCQYCEKTFMRIQDLQRHEEGTDTSGVGESLPAPSVEGPGCPTYSGEGTIAISPQKDEEKRCEGDVEVKGTSEEKIEDGSVERVAESVVKTDKTAVADIDEEKHVDKHEEIEETLEAENNKNIEVDIGSNVNTGQENTKTEVKVSHINAEEASSTKDTEVRNDINNTRVEISLANARVRSDVNREIENSSISIGEKSNVNTETDVEKQSDVNADQCQLRDETVTMSITSNSVANIPIVKDINTQLNNLSTNVTDRTEVESNLNNANKSQEAIDDVGEKFQSNDGVVTTTLNTIDNTCPLNTTEGSKISEVVSTSNPVPQEVVIGEENVAIESQTLENTKQNEVDEDVIEIPSSPQATLKEITKTKVLDTNQTFKTQANEVLPKPSTSGFVKVKLSKKARKLARQAKKAANIASNSLAPNTKRKMSGCKAGFQHKFNLKTAQLLQFQHPNSQPQIFESSLFNNLTRKQRKKIRKNFEHQLILQQKMNAFSRKRPAPPLQQCPPKRLNMGMNQFPSNPSFQCPSFQVTEVIDLEEEPYNIDCKDSSLPKNDEFKIDGPSQSLHDDKYYNYPSTSYDDYMDVKEDPSKFYYPEMETIDLVDEDDTDNSPRDDSVRPWLTNKQKQTLCIAIRRQDGIPIDECLADQIRGQIAEFIEAEAMKALNEGKEDSQHLAFSGTGLVQRGFLIVYPLTKEAKNWFFNLQFSEEKFPPLTIRELGNNKGKRRAWIYLPGNCKDPLKVIRGQNVYKKHLKLSEWGLIQKIPTPNGEKLLVEVPQDVFGDDDQIWLNYRASQVKAQLIKIFSKKSKKATTQN